jgi:ABC-2 type transport system permease protein
MFSKPIFIQTLKANYKLWLIFTAIMCVLSAVIIAVFDPKMMSSMMEMMKDSPMANMMGDQISGMTSLLGMLSQSFYTMQGILLPLIFVIMTANSIIASQVDRGSMAYLLSTPTKRSVVVRTQAAYLITSVVAMFLIVTIVGLFSVQIFQGGVFSKTYTEDVKAASTVLNIDKKDVADDLGLVLKNKEALKAGAEARDIDEDVYTAYLNLKITNNSYKAAADELGVDVDEVIKNPALIKTNDNALMAAAKVMKMDTTAYTAYLDGMISQNLTSSEQATEMQDKMMAGLTAAADVLKVDVADLASDMNKIKTDKEALNASTTASGIPKEMFVGIINSKLAVDEVTADKGIDFSVLDYLMLNFGAFLLMFAVSSISFLFSCIFNLSKNSLALGAGIPIAFFIFQIMSQVGDSLKGFKYLSMNTLFDTNAIVNGGSYFIQFIALGTIGIVLYTIGMRIFKEKDLPL